MRSCSRLPPWWAQDNRPVIINIIVDKIQSVYSKVVLNAPASRYSSAVEKSVTVEALGRLLASRNQIIDGATADEYRQLIKEWHRK